MSLHLFCRSSSLGLIAKCNFAVLLLLMLSLTPRLLHAEQVVVVILDDSGSMRESIATDTGNVTRMEAAKDALANVVKTLPEDTKLGITSLNGNNTGNRVVPLAKLNREEALQRISMVVADGGTPLGQAMRDAADELLAFRKQNIYGAYRLLIITDGEAGDPDLVSTFLPMILARGITVDVIGVAMQSDHQLASQVHSYQNVTDSTSFEKAVSEILAEPNFSQDTSQDFDLIAGLPDELAADALRALSQVDNTPLGKSANDTMSADYANAQTSPTQFGGNVNAEANDGSLCCAVPCFFVVIIIAVLISVISKNKKRR